MWCVLSLVRSGCCRMDPRVRSRLHRSSAFTKRRMCKVRPTNPQDVRQITHPKIVRHLAAILNRLINQGLCVCCVGTMIALLPRRGELNMAYVIMDSCTKDEHCIETCPVNCIHPTKDEADFATAPQLYVNPNDCIDA